MKTKKLKILHFSLALGGLDVYIRLITSHLNESHFESIIVKGKKDKPYLNKINQVCKEYNVSIVREISVLKDLKCLFQLLKIIKKEKPNIVHLHSAKASIIGRLASLLLNKRVLYTPHAFSYLSSSNRYKVFFYKTLEKLFKHSNSLILATSESEKRRAINELGYKPNRVIVFNNAVPPIEINSTPSLEVNFPTKYLCSIGRPSYQKNITAMVKIFNEVKKTIPDLKFVLMGVGLYSPDITKVKELINEYDLEDDFIMIPWIDRERTFSITKKSILYISTARYEGMPYSVIESLALGKAAIVSDCDGNRDLIENNVNGYIIPQESLIEKMPGKIISLLNDEQQRLSFEQQSKMLFNKKYNLENTIHLLESIYKSLS